MRVLVADDDRAGALMLSTTLQRWGLDVVVAHDGEQAWNLAQQSPGFAMAVVDWIMPKVQGPELCRLVRGDAALRGMYLILLTSRAERADVIAGLDSGADDYMTKPFNGDELRARVQVGIRVVTLQQQLAQQVAALQSALGHVKQLSGLLPICCYCHRIRTDQNYWEQVDRYIAQHTDAQFSHGICPGCFDRVRDEVDALSARR